MKGTLNSGKTAPGSDRGSVAAANSRTKSLGVAILFGVLALLAEHFRVLDYPETILRDLRTAQVQYPASGEVAFVAIDARSLQDVGAWPWSRGLHAQLLDNLTEAGALEVFFDIDFAFPSDPEGDSAFADALERAGNTSLAVFRQAEEIGTDTESWNLPLDRFAQFGWPATVNVFTDDRGLVRSYPLGLAYGEDILPSAGAVLSGTYNNSVATFPIDASIDPSSIPTVSAADVLSEQFEPDEVRGKTIIVGASAIELGDFYAVPVHGVVPGPIIHALAAETLIQDRIPLSLRSEAVLGALIAVLYLLQQQRFDSPRRFLPAVAFVVCSIELLSFALLLQSNVLVPTAHLYLATFGFSLWRQATGLNIRDWTITRQQVVVESTDALLRQVFADSHDAMVAIDATGEIRMQSRSAETLFGVDDDGRLDLPAALQNAVLDVLGDARAQNSASKDVELSVIGTKRNLEYTVALSTLAELKGAQNTEVRIATLSVRDVTIVREQERQIAHLSMFDSLTGALRRNAFLDFLALRMRAAEPFAIIAFNLHRFKAINTLLGREVGDEILFKVVDRIETAGMGLSVVARLDGDTFAVFTETPTDKDQAVERALALRDLLSQPYETKGARAQVGAQFGFSLILPDDEVTPSAALGQAEEALDQARSNNAAYPQPYCQSYSEKQRRARAVERAMKHGLEHGEFYLAYQPQHRTSDGALLGSEALIRWKSTELGPGLPGRVHRYCRIKWLHSRPWPLGAASGAC